MVEPAEDGAAADCHRHPERAQPVHVPSHPPTAAGDDCGDRASLLKSHANADCTAVHDGGRSAGGFDSPPSPQGHAAVNWPGGGPLRRLRISPA